MKTMKNPFLLIVMLLILQAFPVYSQNQTDVSNITIGKTYKIVLFDDTEILGVVTASDSQNVSVRQQNGSTTIIPRNNILYYTTDLTPSKYTYSFSASGGVSLMTSENTGYYSYDMSGTVMGPNFNIAVMYFLSDIKAIKVDAGYSFVKPKYDNHYYYAGTTDPLHESYIEGGNLSMYSLKFSLLFGRFIPEEKFMLYGALGIGLHLTNQKEVTDHYWSRSYPDTGTWTLYNYTTPEKNEVNLLLALGGSFGYRFSKKIGAKAEAEFYMITSKDSFIFVGGRNYFPLRLGFFYIF